MIYFVNLFQLATTNNNLLGSCNVLKRDLLNPVSSEEMEELMNYLEPKILKFQIKERFELGAKLWLLKKNNSCLGMIWTIAGRTIEPFYYLIDSQDVHLFNNEIFIPYRGQGFNPILIEYVLFEMKLEGYVRAFIETNSRNIAEQRSLRKTAFVPVGKAIKLSVGKNNITVWRALQ